MPPPPPPTVAVTNIRNCREEIFETLTEMEKGTEAVVVLRLRLVSAPSRDHYVEVRMIGEPPAEGMLYDDPARAYPVQTPRPLLEYGGNPTVIVSRHRKQEHSVIARQNRSERIAGNRWSIFGKSVVIAVRRIRDNHARPGQFRMRLGSIDKGLACFRFGRAINGLFRAPRAFQLLGAPHGNYSGAETLASYLHKPLPPGSR